MIPFDYLLPLAYVIVDRSIVFYDQLGCGGSSTVVSRDVLTTTAKNSDEEAETSNNEKKPILDITAMVEDLDRLLQHWQFPKFHLLGHSFGGILAFEYLKYCQTKNNDIQSTCLSVILASTPTSVKVVENEVQRLCQDLDVDDTDVADDGEDVSALPNTVPKEFRDRYECRLQPTPFPLLDSYSRAGPKHLRGLPAIGNYVASLTSDSTEHDSRIQQPALILRGQHDFVTETCVKGWEEMFRAKQYMTLAGCSHYGMLENETMYGSVLSSFLGDVDEM